MDTIDVLGADYAPQVEGALLAESSDPELAAIVQRAAQELEAPMAIVTIVVDRMQYFLAHHGLPPVLEAARGTERSASFCQFVVRDAGTFEVTDAANDDRLPRLLIEEFGLAAYLGVPVRDGERVVGSLCVLDTQSRGFSPEQHGQLGRLAAAVDQRLAQLSQSRRDSSQQLTRLAMSPGLAELRRILEPLTATVGHLTPALTAIRSYIRLRDFAADGGSTSPRFVAHAQAAAIDALADLESSTFDLEACASDALDTVGAIEQLHSDRDGIGLSTVLHAAQDLARPVTDRVGGARISTDPSDVPLRIPRSLAIGLLTAALTAVAGALMDRGGKASGIELDVARGAASVQIRLRAADLDRGAYQALHADLAKHIGVDPGVSVDVEESALSIRCAVAI